MSLPPSLSILTRRQVEGEILKPVYAILKERFGETTAKEIIGQAIIKVAKETGRQMAAKVGGGTLANFIKIQELWRANDALKVDVLAETPERFDYNVTHCAYATLYQSLGLGDLGFILSCDRDGAFIEGFNPKIKMTRSQTLMEGAPFCDFRYRLTKA
ncbi:MAG: L-2-amino-thiazoline-4-carboxylic acid hydrolase [Deltaproteobacteria bacterium]|jgi:hypothetical protein|nr:L-2-amino-thiazoline-4-carboxylic acid hydrolase [Deltaproteobacteria bacterium]